MDPSVPHDNKYGYGMPPPNPNPPMAMAPPPVNPQQVTVVVNQPQQAQNSLMVTGLDGHRAWSTDLFDCFSDITSCLFTCFCYPCAVCSLASRTGECACTPCCVPGSEVVLRTRIRTVGGIRGSICNDCLVLSCCGPCATCQESRELDNMGVP